MPVKAKTKSAAIAKFKNRFPKRRVINAFKKNFLSDEIQKEKEFTWADLKRLANKIPASQLKTPVIIWAGEEWEAGFKVTDFQILKEDHFFDGDQGCAPKSALKELIEENERLPEDERTDYYLAHKKGTRIIHAE